MPGLLDVSHFTANSYQTNAVNAIRRIYGKRSETLYRDPTLEETFELVEVFHQFFQKKKPHDIALLLCNEITGELEREFIYDMCRFGITGKRDHSPSTTWPLLTFGDYESNSHNERSNNRCSVTLTEIAKMTPSDDVEVDDELTCRQADCEPKKSHTHFAVSWVMQKGGYDDMLYTLYALLCDNPYRP